MHFDHCKMHFSSSFPLVPPCRRHSTLAAGPCITLLSPNFDSSFRANESSKSIALWDCAAVTFGMALQNLELLNPNLGGEIEVVLYPVTVLVSQENR